MYFLDCGRGPPIFPLGLAGTSSGRKGFLTTRFLQRPSGAAALSRLGRLFVFHISDKFCNECREIGPIMLAFLWHTPAPSVIEFRFRANGTRDSFTVKQNQNVRTLSDVICRRKQFIVSESADVLCLFFQLSRQRCARALFSTIRIADYGFKFFVTRFLW